MKTTYPTEPIKDFNLWILYLQQLAKEIQLRLYK